MANILLVDNDAENLWSLRIALVGGGHRVMVAADAGRALAILRHEAVEIMITDYQMPGIDGVQLCEMTRSQPAHSSLPIVLQSAATELAYAPRVWTHFLRRPASIRELIALIDVHAAARLTRAVHVSAGAVRRCTELAASRWSAVNAGCWP
ncbi:response regulator receiver protein [Paraburkholderia hospita]|uniref:Response regulator receiver protein n=2 Tax=Paraburkholderia hospita TaxID=169430 RepID=A0ABN0FDF1_9BURK|nr:response regulator receiver protein [Paraburkholderia hospita]OUL70861.1 response regulator [Paraburkholderia hospita]